MMKAQREVVVIGGGVAGLTAALALADAGFAVDLYEMKDSLGGLVGTRKGTWGISETAANGILNSVPVENLCQRLRITMVRTLPSARARYIYVKGKARRWPLSGTESLGLFLKLLVYRLRGWQRLAPRSGDTVYSWLHFWFGSGVDRKLVAPALQGIYAARSSELNASLVMKSFFNSGQSKVKPKLKGTVAPAGGMGDLIVALERELEVLGVRIHRGTAYQWEKWNPGGNEATKIPHVIATSASQAVNLIAPMFPELSRELSSIQMIPVISATLFFSPEHSFLKGFGCLFAEEEKMNSLGVLFPTSIFPQRSSVHAETWILGGTRRPDLAHLSEEEILTCILEDRKKLGGGDVLPLERNIFIWKQALPLYNEQLSLALKNLTMPSGLYLAGNYLGKIGLAGVIERSLDLPREILTQEIGE